MKKIFFCVCLFFFSYVLFSNTIFIDSTDNIHQHKRNYSNSYNQNPDETIRYIIDKEYRDAKNKRTESYTNYNRFRQEEFDLSKNQDYLDGSENPHTFQGGLKTYSEDPFKEIRESRKEKYLWDLFQNFSILISVFLLIYLTFRFLKYIIIKFKEIDFSISININKKSKEG